MTSSVEDSDESMEEEVPKILSSEIWDVFPFFVNMLDIKSFMKFALTSKEMYNRCMEDKRIHINIKENEVVGHTSKGYPEFYLNSWLSWRTGREQYLNTLRNLSCNVSLRHLLLNENLLIDEDFLHRTNNYLDEIGVTEIYSMVISANADAWQEIISLTKRLRIQELSVYSFEQDPEDILDIPDDTLQSLLELNLVEFAYDGPVEASWLIDADLRMQKLVLNNLSVRSKENFISLIWQKIQKGPLIILIISQDAVDWRQFETLNYSHNEQLPEERPLVFFKDSPNENQYWFLHWNGAVTKCEFFNEDDENEVVIRKCDPIDFPRSLKKKEDVHNALTEKKAVDCLLSHFTSFFDENFNILDSSDDPLPEERPLFFKSGNEAYFILYENGGLENISWAARGSVSYDIFDLKSSWPSVCGHPALARHVFNTQLESSSSTAVLHCFSSNPVNVKRFFEKYRQLPIDYCGPVPEERPVLFEIPSSSIERKGAFAILREDGSIVKCEWYSSGYDDSCSFKIDKCPDCWIPSAAMSADILQNILMKAPQDLHYRIDLKLFRSGFDKFRTVSFDCCDPLPEERPLVMVKTEMNIDDEEEREERWFYQFGRITKCEWRDGEASFSKADPWDLPLALKIEFSREYYMARHSVEKSGKELRRLIRGRLNLSFEHEGPLPEERPLVFDIGIGDDCVYLAEDDTVQLLEFDYNNDKASTNLCPSWRMPSALITTYRLREILLQLPSHEKFVRRLKLETFLSAFEDIETVNLDFAGTLSDERPLVIKKTEEIDGEMVEKRWFLFGDGDDDEVKECIWKNGAVSITGTKKRDLPLPLMKHFINDLLLEAYEEPIQLEIDYFPVCLEGRITLPHDHWGEFEDWGRPLVFVKTEEPNVRILFLIDDTLLKCEFGKGRVFLEKCPREEIPSVLVIAKDIEEIIMEEPTRHEILYCIKMETFLAGFSCFKTLPFDFSDTLPEERPLLFEKDEEDSDGRPVKHRWALHNNFVTKCEWKDGYASFSSADPREFPLAVATTLLKEHLQGKWLYKRGRIFLDYTLFLSCLEEFRVPPFDYNGCLPNDRPLIFEKTEVKHASHLCPDEDYGCSHMVHSLWRLYGAEEVLFCSWSEGEIIFDEFIATDGLPPVLKSKYYLKGILFEKIWPSGSWELEWRGSYEDLLACFIGFIRLSHNNEGPLPKDRPLIFEEELGEEKANFWILRDDDTVIECSYCEGLTLTVSPDDGLPLSLECHLNLQSSLDVFTSFSSFSGASDSASLSSYSSDSTLSSD